MALWNKVKEELNRAGRVAQEALDEGKVRLDLMRTRQAMDRAAQRLGYAVYRGRKSGADIAADEYARLSAELTNAEGEVERLETLLREAGARRKGPSSTPPGTTPGTPPE